MKVVITGGEGFIGKALAAALVKRGIEVISIDRKKGIDAKDFFDTVSDPKDADCVYHLAAQTSVFNTDHAQIMHDNIETFMAVCDACKRAGVKTGVCLIFHGQQPQHHIALRHIQAF